LKMSDPTETTSKARSRATARVRIGKPVGWDGERVAAQKKELTVGIVKAVIGLRGKPVTTRIPRIADIAAVAVLRDTFRPAVVIDRRLRVLSMRELV